MNGVEVTTGSRLHFGLLCGAPESGWHYGGIGMMVREPGWHLHVEITGAGADEFDVPEAIHGRLKKIVASFRQTQQKIAAVRFAAKRVAGMHCGLGSGTQLTLAAGTALLMLSGHARPADVGELAVALGRSQRSAIGTCGFDHGGFIVDCGKDHAGRQRPMERHRFPDDWRMVVLTPRHSEGLSGVTEEQFFGRQRYLDAATVEKADALIRTCIVPALVNERFEQFRTGLGEYGELAGRFYASAQGGIFSSPRIRSLVSDLPPEQTYGLVQSSWGPSAAIPAVCPAHAQELADRYRSSASGEDLDIRVASGRNYGADVRSVAPEGHRSFG